MPELAEVEFFRKQWDCGLKQRVLSVDLHASKRIFRGTETKQLQQTITGATLLESKAHGKQMLFRFSKDAWLGLHLGMTGKLRVEKPGFTPEKHDHLVLQQKKHSLVFRDPRLFGRVLFHIGKDEPAWWSKRATDLLSKEFTAEFLEKLLQRHRKAPLKAVLLMQHRFPGVGNWMADEILWQTKLNPKMAAGDVSPTLAKKLHKQIQFICAEALRIIGHDFSDPPESWLFQHRWRKGGHCPRCESSLKHATVGGRTTCWCPKCQPVVE
ncbi:MAG: DNA-formamidopyrimidine glycosylase [Verrucomicrobiales bacterium]|nr:DNA-formamidopyrimidine glycosylase [Verrucomicrobiales bacterium]